MPARSLRPSTRQSRPRPPADEALTATLDDALERVHDLAMRLWAVREAHPPARGLAGRYRCRGCGQRYPCPTVRAAGPGSNATVLRDTPGDTPGITATPWRLRPRGVSLGR